MFQTLQKFLTPYLKNIGIPDEWVIDVDFWVFLYTLAVAFLGATAIYLHKFARYIILRRNQKRLNRDLHPFYTKAEIGKATRYYIPTKYQDSAPSQAEEPSRSFIDSPKAKLVPMMLEKAFQRDDERYYLILADSGMGKTTFMLNLYMAYKNQFPWQRKFDIRLFPLGHPFTLSEVEKVHSPENTILLLDALDEDIEAVKDYKKRLDEILKKPGAFEK